MKHIRQILQVSAFHFANALLFRHNYAIMCVYYFVQGSEAAMYE